ncbi:protein F [Escherichia phage phiX174]|uniref:Capsid protein F n=1 Tax=Escherichia phage phiX174 TaxID=10847 RepID=E1ANA5_BPPHX|nr:protein F [Escherichia phage phiX174]
MSNIQTGAERMPHDLSHLGFLAGQIGRLITISTTPVIAGDSFEMDAVGALRLSPLRRGLAIDSTVDIFTFYVPHRHVYGEQWIKFMKDGVNATPLPTVNTTGYIDHAAFLGTINPDTNKIPKHLFQGYLNIYNNYFKAPWMPDRTEANPNELNQDDARYGFRCCHLKNIWTAPLPPETELSRQMTTSTTSIDIMGLQAAYANLHTDQERDYFMQRYRDVISSFGGKTSYDADNRPLLVMRSNFWASGYDVDGTDQTSLGQFSGRVQQTYKHSVPRFFVPEHGTMFTLALVRFPPTATKEIQYLNAKGALTYTDIAGDPVLYGNLPPREISMKDVFRSGDPSKKFKIAEGQWYRYAPSYVSPAYHLLEGFPFIQEPPSGDLQERVLIRHHDYDQCFQSVQLLQWNSQVKFNVTVYRNLPTTRDSIMTS